MGFHWGLDVGESGIAAVRLSTEGDVPEVVDYGLARVAASSGGRGLAERRQALTDLVRRLHLRRVAVHAVGPGGDTVVRDVVLTPEDLEGTPETVRRRLLETLPGELATQEVRYEPRERPDEELAYRILGLPRESVERTAGLLASADLERAALQAGALALTEAAERLGGSRGVALLLIETRVTVLSIHTGAVLERYRIPLGEEDLAAAVSARLGVSTAEAYARLDADPEEAGAGETAAALDAPLTVLATDIVRLLEYHRSREPEKSLAALHPIGTVASRPAVHERIARVVTEPPVETLAPPEPAVLARSGRAATPQFERDYPRLLPALGAALLGAGTGEQPLALRPLPPAPEPVRIGLHVAAAVLILLVVLIGWSVTASEHRRIVALADQQERLEGDIPRGSRSPEDLAQQRTLVERRLDLLARKTSTRKALDSLDALFPEPREGESVRLERLRMTGNRVEAQILVRVPRGTDAAAAGEEARTRVPAELRERLGTGATATVTSTTSSYRLIASWEVRP